MDSSAIRVDLTLLGTATDGEDPPQQRVCSLSLGKSRPVPWETLLALLSEDAPLEERRMLENLIRLASCSASDDSRKVESRGMTLAVEGPRNPGEKNTVVESSQNKSSGTTSEYRNAMALSSVSEGESHSSGNSVATSSSGDEMVTTTRNDITDLVVPGGMTIMKGTRSNGVPTLTSSMMGDGSTMMNATNDPGELALTSKDVVPVEENLSRTSEVEEAPPPPPVLLVLLDSDHQRNALLEEDEKGAQLQNNYETLSVSGSQLTDVEGPAAQSDELFRPRETAAALVRAVRKMSSSPADVSSPWRIGLARGLDLSPATGTARAREPLGSRPLRLRMRASGRKTASVEEEPTSQGFTSGDANNPKNSRESKAVNVRSSGRVKRLPTSTSSSSGPSSKESCAWYGDGRSVEEAHSERHGSETNIASSSRTHDATCQTNPRSLIFPERDDGRRVRAPTASEQVSESPSGQENGGQQGHKEVLVQVQQEKRTGKGQIPVPDRSQPQSTCSRATQVEPGDTVALLRWSMSSGTMGGYASSGMISNPMYSSSGMITNPIYQLSDAGMSTPRGSIQPCDSSYDYERSRKSSGLTEEYGRPELHGSRGNVAETATTQHFLRSEHGLHGTSYGSAANHGSAVNSYLRDNGHGNSAAGGPKDHLHGHGNSAGAAGGPKDHLHTARGRGKDDTQPRDDLDGRLSPPTNSDNEQLASSFTARSRQENESHLDPDSTSTSKELARTRFIRQQLCDVEHKELLLLMNSSSFSGTRPLYLSSSDGTTTWDLHHGREKLHTEVARQKRSLAVCKTPTVDIVGAKEPLLVAGENLSSTPSPPPAQQQQQQDEYERNFTSSSILQQHRQNEVSSRRHFYGPQSIQYSSSATSSTTRGHVDQNNLSPDKNIATTSAPRHPQEGAGGADRTGDPYQHLRNRECGADRTRDPYQHPSRRPDGYFYQPEHQHSVHSYSSGRFTGTKEQVSSSFRSSRVEEVSRSSPSSRTGTAEFHADSDVVRIAAVPRGAPEKVTLSVTPQMRTQESIEPYDRKVDHRSGWITSATVSASPVSGELRATVITRDRTSSSDDPGEHIGTGSSQSGTSAPAGASSDDPGRSRVMERLEKMRSKFQIPASPDSRSKR
ncbi:unnamed protein product [Amoebophrya sp. A25]|nr:unnamed protein product [Amoebophrya sp. A25]|eukprot:GSA25T00010349001.1